MNNGVYALPGFMAPAAKNWKSQLLTNEDGSVKLCVYVGKPGTKVYYSLGIPGWKWGFIKDAQYFIDKGYPQEVIEEVSKFADYLEEEVTTLPEGTVIPDIIINGWPLPITESPIEGKVYWILNIPKFILPAGDTEVQISANGKLLKYTITRPDFSIHYNDPGYTIPAGTPGGGSGGSSTGGLTENERELLQGAAQRDADNTFTASNTFTGSVDLSTAQVTPPTGWNVEGAELTPEAIQQVVPIAWSNESKAKPSCTVNGDQIAVGAYAQTKQTASIAIGGYSTTERLGCTAVGWSSKATMHSCSAFGYGAKATVQYATSVGSGVSSAAASSITIGAKFDEVVDGATVTRTTTTEGTGSITIGAGANTLNNGDVESSNSVTIGCKASNTGADSVVIGAQASNAKEGSVIIGAGANDIGTWGNKNTIIGINANAKGYSTVSVGEGAKATNDRAVAIGSASKASAFSSMAFGFNATATDTATAVWAVTNTNYTKTQLYFSGAGTPLANEYYNGEAFMGYTVTDLSGNKLACGTRRLSELFPDNSLTQPASLDENGEWVMPKVFHPSDLDMPIEEPTEPEEYQPLPVYPIVEPEIEDINLINAE